MKVIILGAGQVGHSIARYLSTDENDITVVDTSADVLHHMSDKIDIKPVHGFASHPGVLAKANAYQADLLIAVTASDEVNMVACEVAHSLFGVKTKIARVRHQDYLSTRDISHFHKNMAIDVIISPEVEVAKSLARSSQISGAFEVLSLANDTVKIIAVHAQAKSAIINTPLRLLSTEFLYLDIEIICISRGEHTFFPSPDDVIHPDDDVYFIIRSTDIAAAMEIFGYYNDDKRKIIIVGGGNIGFELAQQLESMNSNIKTKIIEKSAERCNEAARLLRSTEILNGDALDLDVLAEANVQETETILALTQDDKVNILVSLLAKQQGVKRSVALLNKTNYAGLVTSLGVDAIINPRVITVSTILQHVCQGRLRAIHSVADGYAEIIEAEARETSTIIGLTVEDITIRGNLHVIAIVRGKEIIINPTKMIISAKDIIVLIVKKESARKAERLFYERPVYL